MSKGWPVAGIALMLGAGAAQLPALAKSPRPDPLVAAVERRQASMKGMRDALKSLAAYSKGTTTDASEARVAAITIQQISRQLPRMWPAGTAVGVGTSKAKPEIWSQRAEFGQRLAALRTAAAAMSRAASSKDKAKVAQQLSPLSDACKACHTAFQVKKSSEGS